MGRVGGYADLDKKNRAYALAVKEHAYDQGTEPVIRVLFVHDGEDEAYACPSTTSAYGKGDGFAATTTVSQIPVH